MRPHTLSLVLALLASPCVAQFCVEVSDPDPNANTGIYFSPPRQDRGLVLQFRVSRLEFGNLPRTISSLAIVPSDIGVRRFERIEVRLGHTTVAPLVAQLEVNRTGPMTTVLDTDDHVWPNVPGVWNEVGLQRGFVYHPSRGDLLVEFVLVGGQWTPARHNASPDVFTGFVRYELVVAPILSWPGQVGTAYVSGTWAPRLRICSSHASVAWFGEGCTGTNGTPPALGLEGPGVLGTSIDVVVSNTPPMAPAILALATAPGTGLPLDLTGLGMPGCRQYVPLDTTLALTTDANGIARLSLAIPPAPLLLDTIVLSQAFPLDPGANPAGLTATNWARLVVGR